MSPPILLRQRYVAVLRLMILVAVPAYGGYLLLSLLLGIPFLPVVNVIALGLLGLALWGLDRGLTTLALTLMALLLPAHALLATALFSWRANFHLFGLLTLVFLMLGPDFGPRCKFAMFLILTAAYVLADLLLMAPLAPLTDGELRFIGALNLSVFCMMLATLAHRYAKIVNRSTHELHAKNAELMRLATTDAMTGLLNRRQLSEQMQQELLRCRRSGRPFSVILGDVDDFKSINDVYGHQAGDVVLIALSQMLREAVRTQDLVARWGGEEFLVFLPETTAREAEAVTHRIQQRIARSPIPCEAHSLSPRMTFGIAESAAGQTLDALLHRADRALYRGKSSGKDRVVVAS